MANKKGKGKDNNGIVETKVTTLEDLSREELSIRYQDNIRFRKELAEENQVLLNLWKSKKGEATKASAEAKLAALQAKLAALTNPSPAAPIVVTPAAEEAPISEELAG